MALEKSTEITEIRINDTWSVGVRTDTVIKEDGVELTRAFFRKTLSPGTLDASDNLVDTNISSESADVKGIAATVWTSTVKDAWKAKLIADKPS